MRTILAAIISSLILAGALFVPVLADDTPANPGEPQREGTGEAPTDPASPVTGDNESETADDLAPLPARPNRPERIQFFATLESAQKEARRTNRPILFTSARLAPAPGCW